MRFRSLHISILAFNACNLGGLADSLLRFPSSLLNREVRDKQAVSALTVELTARGARTEEAYI